MRRSTVRNILVLLLLIIISSSQVYSAPATNSKKTSSNSASLKFPSCPTPGGSQVAGYPQGWHWIVGESTLRWGSDFVFRVSDARYVQCYCPLDGTKQGIQTNWLPLSLVTEETKQNLLTKGWIYVANGADFGLEAVPFLAQNQSSKCSPPKPSPSTKPSPTPKPTPSPICETVVDQSNQTKAAFSIDAGSQTGKNSANANIGGPVKVTTGHASTDIGLTTTGGDNVAQKTSPSSPSSGLHIVISENGDGSTNTVQSK